MATVDSTTLNTDQYLSAMSEISTRADNISKVCEEALELLGPAEPEVMKMQMEQVSALLCAARDMAKVIGYIGDQHGGGYMGSAEHWFLPPSWHDAAEPRRVDQ